MGKETQVKPKPFRTCTLTAAASTLKTEYTEDDYTDDTVSLQAHLAKYCEPSASVEKEYFCLAACVRSDCEICVGSLNGRVVTCNFGVCRIAHAKMPA
jgi:hypothetical protein